MKIIGINKQNSLFSNCKNKYSSLCIAGGDPSTQVLITIGCAYCQSVLVNKTVANTSVLNINSGTYWYYTDSLSFGFSPTSTINQVTGMGDTFDLSDKERLSWNIDGINGGYRLGVYFGILNQYKKYGFDKEMVLFDCPSKWIVFSNLNCTLTQNYKTSLQVVVSFGNNVVQTLNVVDQVTQFTSKYNVSGVYKVSMIEANL